MTLYELLILLRKHLGIVLVLPVAALLASALYCVTLQDVYTASTTMYVLSQRSDDEDHTLTSSDLSAGQMLANDVASILTSHRVFSEVGEQHGLAASLPGLSISVDSSTSTRVITLEVTSADPELAASVANEIVSISSDIAVEVMAIDSINVIDRAEIPTTPSGPPRKLYLVAGACAGFFLAVVVVLLLDMADTRLRSEDEVFELLGVPMLGSFPTFSEVDA